MKAPRDYVLSKAKGSPELLETLQTLLGVEGLRGPNHLGFVFSERLINLPVPVVPPMYKILSDEIQWAIDDASICSPNSYLSL